MADRVGRVDCDKGKCLRVRNAWSRWPIFEEIEDCKYGYVDTQHLVLLSFFLRLVVLLGWLLEEVTDAVFELLPRVAVQAVTELAVVVHLGPTIATPLTPSHVDQEVAILLLIVNANIVAAIATCAGRKAVDLALLEKSDMRSNPRLVLVHILKSVLLLVFPLHVLLLVANRIPPNV